MKKIILFFVIFILILLLFLLLKNIPFNNIHKSNLQNDITNNDNLNTSTENIENNVSENIVKESRPKETPITFTMTAIGDSLCHNTQYWDAYNKETGEYDFSYVYEDIRDYTKYTDITIGSLETTFAGEERGYSNYPTFNTPDSLAKALKNIGVDIISCLFNNFGLKFSNSFLII